MLLSLVDRKADTRATIREFFKQLIAKQPKDNRDNYAKAAKVAIAQRQTIKNLKGIRALTDNLYSIAIRAFRLKDRVV